jgi:hypothetical protein
MLAITGQHVIVLAQGRNRTDRDGLLPDVKMAKAANLPQAVGLGAFFFKAPDENHLAQKLDQRFAIFLQRG